MSACLSACISCTNYKTGSQSVDTEVRGLELLLSDIGHKLKKVQISGRPVPWWQRWDGEL